MASNILEIEIDIKNLDEAIEKLNQIKSLIIEINELPGSERAHQTANLNEPTTKLI